MLILRVHDAGTPGPPPEARTENEMEIIVGGIFRDIAFLEGPQKTPRVERMLIRKISIRDMDVLAKAWGKIKLEVGTYLDLKPDDVAKLSDESFEVAMTEGRRLNFTPLSKWLAWQAQTLEALGQSNQFDKIMADVTKDILSKVEV